MDKGLINGEFEKTIKNEQDENFVITGRKITGFFENIAVTCDSFSNNIRFTMADTYDGISLWDKEIKIIYKTPDGYTDFAYPHSVSRENGIMYFSWLLSENVARLAGNVTYAIRISDGDFVWNSLPACFKVSQGIIESGEEIPEYASEWIKELDEKLLGMPKKIEENEKKTDEIKNSVLNHTENKSNPHGLTKSQIGLSNADNTSDADKPISILTQKALDEKAEKALLKAHIEDKNNPHGVTRAQLNLENVDNTSDMNKPISYQALSEFETVKTSIREHNLNNNNPHKITKAQLGLSNVDNTSDEDKPVSNAVKQVLDKKEEVSNKVNVIDDSADNRTYPTTGAVKKFAEGINDKTKSALGGLVFSVNENGILNISKEE